MPSALGGATITMHLVSPAVTAASSRFARSTRKALGFRLRIHLLGIARGGAGLRLLVLVDLACLQIREHVIADILEDKRFCAVADHDPLALLDIQTAHCVS